MAGDNLLDDYYVSPLSYDKDGVPMADAPFTATRDSKRHAVIVHPDKVVPIVFVPGIMGSNLRLSTLPDGFANKQYTSGVNTSLSWPPVHVTSEGWGDVAWRPDDVTAFMARRFWPLKAYERRLLLDPANTTVDDRGAIDDKTLSGFAFDNPADGAASTRNAAQRKLAFQHELTRRGWGTVTLASYGPLLAFLEKTLNQIYKRGALDPFWSDTIVNRQDKARTGSGPTDWGIVKGDRKLMTADVKKAAAYWYPVHAVGYNWIQSNTDSANHVAERVNSFIQHYADLGYECKNVILVTHSMGGLVARAAVHPKMGKIADSVVGAIHGVMPTNGAGAAYTRCHGGFEGAGIKGSVVADILGRDGPEIAAVFSNSPGALQLLPNKAYGPNWLSVEDMVGRTNFTRPANDPFDEIYRQRDVWWRLMDPAWLDPRPRSTQKEQATAWSRYRSALNAAEKFHDDLGSGHHPHTHVQYGVDKNDFMSFGKVTWRARNASKGLAPSLVNSLPTEDDTSGPVTVTDAYGAGKLSEGMQPVTFAFGKKDEPGDGTVPAHSAAALNASIDCVAEHAGYGHQESYKDARAQQLVAYSIVRLVSENMP